MCVCVCVSARARATLHLFMITFCDGIKQHAVVREKANPIQ